MSIVEPFCRVAELTPEEVASACRTAGLAFVNGAAKGTKVDLARWLLGPYRAAAFLLQGTQRAVRDPDLCAPVLGPRVERLLEEARARVLHTLEASSDDPVDLPWQAMRIGSIVPSRHDNGESGYVAIDWPRMRLAARVTSLFAVDCQLRSDDYARKLVVCRRCQHVTFDAVSRAGSVCERHVRPSSRSPGVRHSSGVHQASPAPLTEMVIPSRDRRAL
jgi:hypothetical protein